MCWWRFLKTRMMGGCPWLPSPRLAVLACPLGSSLIALVKAVSPVGIDLAGLRVLSAVGLEACRMLASDGGSAEVVHAVAGKIAHAAFQGTA